MNDNWHLALEQRATELEERVRKLETTSTAKVCTRDDCNEDAQAPHACPYKSELHGNEEPCTCCRTCERECAQDI